MTEVRLLGQTFWGTKIAEAINRQGTEFRARFVPSSQYWRALAAPRRDPEVFIRVGYRVGASTWRGRSFDVFWSLLCRSRPHALRVHYWHGTDVHNTSRESREGTLRLGAFSSSRGDLHITVADWLAHELSESGITAHVLDVPMGLVGWREDPTPSPGFSVLTYAGPHRFGFYGGPMLLRVAQRLPSVRFDIVGTDGDGAAAPANVTFHGWTNDMPARYRDAAVVVRIPEHDGMGRTVVEALLFARHVVYNYHVPHTRFISPVSDDSLVRMLEELWRQHARGELGLNLAGRAYVLRSFDRDELAQRLIELFRSGIKN